MNEEKHLVDLPCKDLYALIRISVQGLELTKQNIEKLVQRALQDGYDDHILQEIVFFVSNVYKKQQKAIIRFQKQDRQKILRALALMSSYNNQYCRIFVQRLSPFLLVLAADSNEFVDSIQFP
eukprot:TRINITY_DN8730_c2_g1_i1.p2 TRINITY_DN8730_c2_g1~~TRINITY_DN8730_c2_g1_i1.p2  ORF type:complete len:123 (-),score=11.86 TRINITY_DN8730_c2_g1_i1:263-631(-)